MELSSHDRHDLVMIMLMQSSGRLATTQLANKAKLKFINQSFMKGYILINMIYLLCSTVLFDPYLLFVSIKVFYLSKPASVSTWWQTSHISISAHWLQLKAAAETIGASRLLQTSLNDVYSHVRQWIRGIIRVAHSESESVSWESRVPIFDYVCACPLMQWLI